MKAFVRITRSWTRWLLPASLILAAVLIYGRYLGRDHFTASGDFPPAVSYALNYRLAVDDGQWIPRLVVIPRDISLGLGSIDGTEPTADAPDFQYYAFLQSALAYVFLLLGAPAIKSVQLVVVAAFSLGALLVYVAGRTVGARPGVAFLAGYGYIISPWLVSNFYGRGGISEALGQASLSLLLLGLALLFRERFRSAILATAAGIAALALSHNIFLLYGILLCAIFAVSLWLFPSGASGPHARWWIRLRAPLVITAGGALGLAVTAWQWLPAMLTLKETSFHYYGAFSAEGRVPKNFTDWSGALGLPRQFVEPWSGQIREFFFTIGWWTIPSILMLACCRREFRPTALAVLLGFGAFVLLMIFPQQIYPYLPGPFGATQYTFRLLAFLSLLGSFALCLALPNLNRWAVVTALGLMTWSQLHVINFPMAPAGGTTALHEEQYLKGCEYNAFYANSPHEQNLRFWYDGWLQSDNLINLHQRFWNYAGASQVEDLNGPGRTSGPVYLRIKGRVTEGLPRTSLSLKTAAEPARLASNTMEVAGESFDVTLAIPDARESLRLTAEPTLLKGGRHLSIQPRAVYAMWGAPGSLVSSADLRLVKSHGYQRVFVLAPGKARDRTPDPGGTFTIEIPMIYSRFLDARQAGSPLATTVDFNHRLNVRTSDPAGEITVTYRLPAIAWWLTALGLAIGLVLAAGVVREIRDLVLGGRAPASR